MRNEKSRRPALTRYLSMSSRRERKEIEKETERREKEEDTERRWLIWPLENEEKERESRSN